MTNVHSKPILGMRVPIHPLPLPPTLTRRPYVLAFLVLILLRSRAAGLTFSAYTAIQENVKKLRDKLRMKLKRKLTREEMDRVLQQVYVEDPDGSGGKTLLVPYRERILKVPIHTTPTSKFTSDTPFFPPLSESTLRKPSLSLSFLSQLTALLGRIAIPSATSPEAGIVVLHSSFLVLRTVLSILVARLDGRIVRDLVKGDGRAFLRGLGWWFVLAIPSTFTNSMIRHFQSLLALRLRTRMTRYLHDLYLASHPALRYFRAPGYLDGVDQYLTADVDAWANALSGVYGNVLKPSLDLLLFTSQLSRSLGVRGTILLFLNYYTTVSILRFVTPSFGALAATEARLEGEYRMGVGRVGREAEEVAFYDGGKREKEIVLGVYAKLIRHVNKVYKIRIAYEWTEDYVIKYLWSAAGYALIAVPILYTRAKRSLGVGVGDNVRGADGAERMRRDRDEAVAGRTETDAGGRLMYAYKDLLELAGLTARLYVLVSTLLNMPSGRGVRCVDGAGVGDAEGEAMGVEVEEVEAVSLTGVDVRVPRVVRGALESAAFASDNDKEKHEGKGKGKEKEKEKEKEKQQDEVKEGRGEGAREDPPLVKNLTLRIARGEHLMITGSNGVGKTAVARVLAGLWDPAPSSDGVNGEGEPHVQMPRDETEADVLFRRAAFLRAREVDAGARFGGAVGAGAGGKGAEALKHEREHWRPRPTLYVVPQRAYMVAGSLLEQIIYPCSYASFVRMTSMFSANAQQSQSHWNDPSYPPTPATPTRPTLLSRSSSVASLTNLISSTLLPPPPSSLVQMPSNAALAEIHNILEKVHLGYLVGREGGLHVRKEWRDVLSGGEKQRMAMARVLWWRPRFAVLDECTSAVSSDVEGRMYEAAKALDITLITISLRPSLMKYHKQLLTLHGPTDPTSPGRWTLARVGTKEERMSLEKEIGVLEERLKEVEGWEKRVRELEGLLGVQEGVGEGEGEHEHTGSIHTHREGVDEEGDRDEEEEARLREEEMKEEVYVYDYREPEGSERDLESESTSWSDADAGDIEAEGEVEVESVGTEAEALSVGFEDAVDPEEMLSMPLDVEEEMTFA
uniref:ABC transporter domain-containing protein n=1 Tax=Psilocybe cubensis TaxID=181762 RepID=A0A8H7XQK2_PSICU